MSEWASEWVQPTRQATAAAAAGRRKRTAVDGRSSIIHRVVLDQVLIVQVQGVRTFPTRRSIVVRLRSSFVVRCSSFVVRLCSSFLLSFTVSLSFLRRFFVIPSSFLCHSFVVPLSFLRRSSFVVRRSSFVVRRSLRPS